MYRPCVDMCVIYGSYLSIASGDDQKNERRSNGPIFRAGGHCIQILCHRSVTVSYGMGLKNEV